MFVLGALALSAIALTGCSSPIADLQSLGPPPDVSAQTKDTNTYLAVHDLPPDRDDVLIPADQRAKIEAELIAARDHQASVTPNSNGK
jgi:hypothetical protein